MTSEQPRYRFSIVETTGHGSDRVIRDLVSVDVPPQLVPHLRSTILQAIAGFAYPPDTTPRVVGS